MTEKRPPVHLALVIDTSGSMTGDAIAHARDAALELLDELDDGDRLAVVAFHSHAQLLVPSTEISATSKDAIADELRTMKATGTTDMAGGMAMALQQLASHPVPEGISRMVLLSDGVPNDATPIMNLASNAQSQHIAITALGLGVEYDETLLANLAKQSGGSFHYIEDSSRIAQVFQDEVVRIERVVAQGMQLHLMPGPGVTVTEVIGHHRTRPPCAHGTGAARRLQCRRAA